MIKRILEYNIKKSLKRSASVALLGPRQVGKTTLAHQIAKSAPSIYLDLENTLDLKKIKDISTFYKNNNDTLIILDEVQRLPEVFSQIRGIIDSQRRKGIKGGIFLFLGSASIELLKQSSESLVLSQA